MELHSEHVTQYSGYMMNKILGGKTIFELKNQHIAAEKQRKHDFINHYPDVGDKVYFRSINNSTQKTYTGYGVVLNVRVKSYIDSFALYTIKADIGDTVYQVYLNHPNQQGEFVRDM